MIHDSICYATPDIMDYYIIYSNRYSNLRCDIWYNNQYIIAHQMIQQSVCYDTRYSNLPYYWYSSCYVTMLLTRQPNILSYAKRISNLYVMTLLIQRPKFYYPPIDTATSMSWYLIQQPILFSYNNWYSNLPPDTRYTKPNILLLSNWYNSQPNYYTLPDTSILMLRLSWYNNQSITIL